MHRLKTRPQFQATMAAGTLVRTPHFALHCLRLDVSAVSAVSARADGEAAHRLFAPADAARWLGPLVPKRWARRAVTRNAIRRQIYAVAQHFTALLPAAAYVVRLRAAFDRTQFPSAASLALKRAVRAELEQLFTRALARLATP